METSIPRKLRRLPKWPSLSPFSRAVLAATYAIPKGETRTYAQVAKMAARLSANRRLSASYSRAYRAVGSVMRKNPFAPLVPCHRVIKSDGSLGNYSGKGGVAAKKRMLEKEEQ